MLISVIIIAYNRKNFVTDAVNSALNQTLRTNQFEVIVVTNFQDEVITKLHYDMKIKHVYLKDGTVGKFILEGLKISSGDIITFLDDDDLYDSKRLGTIYEIFSNYPDVNYYKSNIIMVDSLGKVLPGKRSKQYCHRGLYSRRNLLRKGNLQRLQLNLSSTTVRKKVFDPFIQILPEMSIGQDIWLYYMAMAYGGLMYLDCTPLTYYRIHNFQITGTSSSVNHYLAGYISTFELEKAIHEGDVRNDLEKTRYRMLVLSLSRGYNASLEQILGGFEFYLRHFKLNIRDCKVLAYSVFALTSQIAFKKKATSIISKITNWFSRSGFI